jgi:crotonobetainyl-CoA:carnitine CoA-transferase CaiB-like acyl-CoA transferase
VTEPLDGAAPLAGTTVVDLSLGIAGPFAASRLGDLGARVIKVEPLTGDPARGHGPPFVDDDAAVFLAVNRGKSSLAVDLRRAEGGALARRVLAAADVVVEDLGPGRAADLGLGYDDLAAEHPGLVYVAVSAWGEAGPLADARLPGAELPVQAMAEYLSSLGRIGEGPVRLGADVAGLNTGIFASQAALAALVARDVGGFGRGQRVAVSMLGTLLHLRGIMWTARSNPDEWWGFHLDHYTDPPETGYRTKDGQVFFGLRRGDSEDFDQLMISLGLVEHITNPVFGGFGRDAAPLGRHSVEAKPIWEQGFAELTTDEVIDLFHERGGDAVPFTDYPLITTHPQTEAIGALCDVPLAGGGRLRGVAPVWQFSETPAAVGGPAPRLGEHTDAVLAELGFSPAEVARLRADGVVA